MESLKTMHIKRFVAHLLTFRHTVYYRIWFFCRPFRRTGREHHKTSDKPPPAGVGSRDGLLYVYHTADCSPLWCVVGCVVLYRTRRRPLVRCRSPPNVQDSQKFLNDLEDKTMRYRNNGQIEEELQIRFTGYLIQAVKRTRRDYLNTLNQYSNRIFEQLLFQAKEGDLESITDILNMYRPLLLKYSVIDGRLDEDLYQEQCITLMRAIKLFRI